MTTIRRRAFLGAAGSLAAGCSPAATKKAPPEASEDWHDVSFPASRGIPDHRALVYAPPGSSKWPILIALHGRGEAGRGLRIGAYGWRDDYDLPRALATLRQPRDRIAHVWIDAEGRLMVNDLLIGYDELAPILGEKLRRNPELVVALNSDRRTEYTFVHRALGELKKAEAVRVSFTAQKIGS